ncbi:hypothetical protein RHO12_04755 [Orbus sturtevantii]|uniref:fumarate reductase subunit C n=1 Tax=Orbus sturtevantii TaxID=3074109 RepID=UPI00370DB345
MKINETDESYRKPCSANIPNNWWLKLRYYLFYTVRESTSFFMLWVSIVLMYGVICTNTNEMGRDEFYRFIFFLQHPVVIVLNVLSLVAALFHSITWFNLVPKATNIVLSRKKLSPILVTIGFWLVTIAVSTALLLLVFGYFK